jgi:membrane-bound inhibitor of C-type lysozyme
MRLPSLLFALLACGCVHGPEMAVLPETIAYRCAEGREMLVRRAPDGSEATATVDGRDVRLRRTESAAQEKYVEGNWTLYLEGEGAMLDAGGSQGRAACRSTTPLPVMQRSRY